MVRSDSRIASCFASVANKLTITSPKIPVELMYSSV
jgi:hypothetical protein